MHACREAQIEQRMARREAAKERDQSPEQLKLLGGGDIMGGDDSFSSAKARCKWIGAADGRCRQTMLLANHGMLVLSSKGMLWGLEVQACQCLCISKAVAVPASACAGICSCHWQTPGSQDILAA